MVTQMVCLGGHIEGGKMRIIITGDWHLTNKSPRCRVDNYVEAQAKKIEFVTQVFHKEECDIALQPGDLCDNWKKPDSFKTFWMGKLNGLGLNLYAVTGQHDMRYHTADMSNTPFGVLKEAVGFKLLGANDKVLNKVSLYGASWGEEIPKVKDKSAFNILVIHKMIVVEKLWAEQENYEVAGTFLRRNKFDLIVSGDNHNSFHHTKDNRWLINCGSLMRSEIDQKDHKPCVWIFDTGKREAEQVFIPIEPFDKVVSTSIAEQEKKRSERIDALAESLKKRTNIKGLDFIKRVHERVESLKKKNEIDKRTENFINRIMET